jgi:D-alanyl-D-alanine carboxypeptidase (penicillin-binding protein 5/6)
VVVEVASAAPDAPAGASGRGATRGVELTCASCLLVDDTHRVLLARRARVTRPNASTTKMVTALVVARRADPGEVVTVSQRAAATGGGGLDLRAGERYTVRELLVALLLTSSNDASVALAEHVAGTEAAFVGAMNRLAERLGARRSSFVTPHGLDRLGHFSTAADLARVAEALLAHDLLGPIVAASRATITSPGGALTLENRNALLETYRGAIGVKTGFTDDAGDVLVAAARRRGRTLIAVALGARDAAGDCRRMLDRGFARLASSVVLRAQRAVGAVVFDPAGATAATAATTVRGAWHPGAVQLFLEPDPGVRPPLRPGDPLGDVVVRARGEAVARVAALAASPVGGGEPPALLETLGDLLRAGRAAAEVVGVV